MYAIKWIVGLVLALALPCLGASQANYPAYSTAAHTVYWGPDPDAAADGTPTVGASADNAWAIAISPLTLSAGTYTLTEWQWVTSNTLAEHCDDAYLVMYSLSGDTYTLVWSKQVYSGLNRADTVRLQTASSLTETITVGSATYYVGAAMHRVASGGAAGKPGLSVFDAGNGPQTGVTWTSTVTGDASALASINTAVKAPSAVNENLMQGLTLTTRNRTLTSFGTAAIKAYPTVGSAYILPSMGADYWILLRNVVVADGQALTVLLQDHSAGADSTKQTLVLDMGAADQVTWGADNVALNAGVSEGGNTFDIGINLRPVANEADVFWVNKTVGQGAQTHVDSYYRDIATFSHAAKEAAGSRHAAGEANTVEPTYITLSGTATVETIQVAYQPIVLCGDSQMGTKNNAATAAAYTRLGSKLPTAFTEDRCYWLAAIAGNTLCADVANSSTALSSRFKHATAGLGDLCEMTGVVFVFQTGLNDITTLVSSAATQNPAVTELSNKMATILDDIADRAVLYPNPGSHAVVIGLPAYSDGDEYEAATISQWNHALEGLSLGARCSFHSSFSAATDGTHYTDAGATATAATVTSKYESGRTSTGAGGQHWIEW